MRDFILTSSATILCPHGGIVNHIPSVVCEYRIEGSPPMLVTDQYLIAGCPHFSSSPYGMMPSPCFSITWTNPSIYLIVAGVPALKHTSQGLCMSPAFIPQGPAVIASYQTRVSEPDTVTNVR